MSSLNNREKRGKNKILMSCQRLVKCPDVVGNLIILSTQQQPCECHNTCTAAVLKLNEVLASDKAKDKELEPSLDASFKPTPIPLNKPISLTLGMSLLQKSLLLPCSEHLGSSHAVCTGQQHMGNSRWQWINV